VLVAGGLISGFPHTDKVEVVDIEDSTYSCVGPSLPVGIREGTIALLEDEDKVIVCGGYNYNGVSKECYSLSRGSSEWKAENDLNAERNLMSSSVVGNKWVISGDYDTSGVNSATLDIYENGIFTQPSYKMSVGKSDHCQVSISDTVIFITGGITTVPTASPSPESFYLDLTSGGFFRDTLALPTSQIVGSMDTVCGLVNDRY